MAAPKGHTYWKLVANWKNGADRLYNPETLWAKFIDYVAWIEENPLKEQKVFASGVKLDQKKHRAMTIRGFCVFAQMSTLTFQKYEREQTYVIIVRKIKDIIYTQKFEGAAAGLFETNIIARELGLIEKQEVTTIGDRVSDSPLNDLPLDKLLAIKKIISGNE